MSGELKGRAVNLRQKWTDIGKRLRDSQLVIL